MLRVETVDSPTWYAILFIDVRYDQPTITCVGFSSRRQRDEYLARYGKVAQATFDAVMPG